METNDSDRIALTNLLAAFEQVVLGPPSDLAAFVREQLSIAPMPLPWETWTLINLVRYRARQFWAKEIVFGHLLKDVPTFAKALRKKRRLTGYVPQHPEWEFDLDGVNGKCCLTNRVTNEIIGVGATEYESADAGYSQEQFVWAFCPSRVTEENSVEARLRELHPSGGSLLVSWGELTIMGSFEACDEELADIDFGERLADVVVEHADAIAHFSQAWKDPSLRLWLSALVGDWFAVSDLAATGGIDEIASLAMYRAEACRSQRIAWITGLVEKSIEIDSLGLPVTEWFHALNELDGTKLTSYLRRALSMRHLAFCALRYIEEQNDPIWCPEVCSLFEKALQGKVSRDDPKGQVLKPVSDEHPDNDDLLAVRCATFLAKHGYRAAEVVTMLAANENSIAETILLVLQYVPDLTMEVLRRCMSSSRVRVVFHAAAVLALIGGPESEALCLTTMKESDDPLIVAYSQTALYAMWDKGPMLFAQEAVRRLLRWAHRNNRLVMLDLCDATQLKKGDDPLAADFLQTVESLSDVVLTHRRKTVANAEPAENSVAVAIE